MLYNNPLMKDHIHILIRCTGSDTTLFVRLYSKRHVVRFEQLLNDGCQKQAITWALSKGTSKIVSRTGIGRLHAHVILTEHYAHRDTMPPHPLAY